MLTNIDTIVKALGGTGAVELAVAVVVGVVWVTLVVWAVKQERLARELDPELDGETGRCLTHERGARRRAPAAGPRSLHPGAGSSAALDAAVCVVV